MPGLCWSIHFRTCGSRATSGGGQKGASRVARQPIALSQTAEIRAFTGCALRDTATQLAAQTTFGAAKMVLETGYHPALLKDQVTTPAGCTIDGILELEEGGLRVTLIKAVMRATERAKQLASG